MALEPTPTTLWELAAEEVARKVRTREVSAVEVTEAALARAAAVEPLLSAYLALYPEEARADPGRYIAAHKAAHVQDIRSDLHISDQALERLGIAAAPKPPG